MLSSKLLATCGDDCRFARIERLAGHEGVVVAGQNDSESTRSSGTFGRLIARSEPVKRGTGQSPNTQRMICETPR
jgi:hypothetical protein